MGKPDNLGAIGSRSGMPQLTPGVDMMKLDLDPAQYFVLSRVDGRTSIGEILALVPFSEAETVAVLEKLQLRDIIRIPGTGLPQPKRAPTPVAIPAVKRTVATTPPSTQTPTPAAPPPTDGIELSLEQRRRIDETLSLVDQADPHLLLGVTPGSDEKVIRRTYFKLSKEFHPDRYFGKSLGPYGGRLAKVFAAIHDAFSKLTASTSKKS